VMWTVCGWPLEEKVLELTAKHSATWSNRAPTVIELEALYQELDKVIIDTYKQNGLQLR